MTAAMPCLLLVAAVLLLFFQIGKATCPAGYYCPNGASAPLPCPEGHYCPEPRTQPNPCPPGTCSKHYVSDRTTCQSCSKGYYQDKSGQKTCYGCPQGHSCLDPRARPTPCPPGTQSHHYIYDRLTCQNCSNGHYQDKSGQRDCLVCPRGHYCPAPKTRPIPCPPGTQSRNYVNDRLTCAACSDGYYQDKPGQSDCIACPRGSYCPHPKNRAIPCPAGLVGRNYINERVTCGTCSYGYYQDKTGQYHCLRCPEGHECPSPKNGSIPCPPGFRNGYYRLQNEFVNCLACNAGYYQTRKEQTQCNLCPSGHYCPQKENGPVPCPPGFTSASQASDRISCVRCNPGQCLGPVTPPVVCQPGMFLDTNTKSCKPCETGQYQADPGQSSCQICPEGFYCPTTTAKPIPCPIGTYSTKEMGLKTACPACSIGTYQMKQGQNLCLPCPVGHFCAKPNLNPMPCPPGTYATDSATDRTTCLPCSRNEYQDQSGQQGCKPCPAGYFCPTRHLSPQQCPPNTYSTSDQTDRAKCLPCPAGQYQDQCGQAQCKVPFDDGTSPSPRPILTCPNLNISETVSGSCLCNEHKFMGAYIGAPVRNAMGNNGVMYPVVKIAQEHLTPGDPVIDDVISVSTAVAFDKMATAAKLEGVTITINSGFRTYERQEYLFNCSITKLCNNGNKAAKPGKSNHGTGIALDLNTNCGSPTQPDCATSAVYTWLKNHGHKFGFVRTVSSEPWHWEFQGGPVAGPSTIT